MPPADAAMATMPYGSPGSARGDCGSLIAAHRPGDAHAHGKRSGPSGALHAGGPGASLTALIAVAGRTLRYAGLQKPGWEVARGLDYRSVRSYVSDAVDEPAGGLCAHGSRSVNPARVAQTGSHLAPAGVCLVGSRPPTRLPGGCGPRRVAPGVARAAQPPVYRLGLPPYGAASREGSAWRPSCVPSRRTAGLVSRVPS